MSGINENPMYENKPRYAGILLHITSLPGPYGIGDLGSEAYQFADSLSDAKVGLWQVLPLGPVGFGSSPYAARSSFAGNELFISPDILLKNGLLDEAETSRLKSIISKKKQTDKVNRVDFHLVEMHKMPLLKKAARRFMEKLKNDPDIDSAGFNTFCHNEAYWLDDYAVFQVLCDEYYDARWHSKWNKSISKRRLITLRKIHKEKENEILEWKVLQYFFECQWQKLKSYVNSKGIKIIGDIPIFAATDSADTWTHLNLFKTDRSGKFTFVSGVPPDYFSSTGQLWGNPVYNWKKMKLRGYSWWVERIRRMLTHVDLFRIDHFRGFDEYWSVPSDHTTAEHGTWEKGPGADLFHTLEKKLGKLPVLAEDLGFLTEGVKKLRDDLGFPGMKVCQFGFEDMKNGKLDARHLFLPHNYSYNWAAYTGTHDNNTTAGWYSKLNKEDQNTVTSYLNCKTNDPKDITWAMIRAVISSQAQYAIFPLQDLLGLGEEARFNLPSTCKVENWSWRLRELPSLEIIKEFASLVELYSRGD